MKPFLDTPYPLNIAHRGGMGLAPENTLKAYSLAVANGSHAFELDVHPTTDGEVVVIHDSTVDRTTNGYGKVQELTIDEIKKLDAGYTFSTDNGKTYPFRSQGITVPTLEEVLQTFPEQRINIEVKEIRGNIEQKIFSLIKKYGMAKQVLVAAEKEDCSRALRPFVSKIARSASYKEVRNFFVLLCLGATFLYNAKADAFQIPEYYGNIHLVTPRFIRAAHKKNIKVHVWTINEQEDMVRLLRWGVDGIVTDYPERLQLVLQKFFYHQNVGV